MPIGKQNTKILPNKAPIMVIWVPRETGATLPDGENSKFNYVDILIKHKQENNEKREMMLILNDPQNRTNHEFMPGFLPGQIDDLKNKFKGVNGIHIVNLHDPKYDRYWEEIDQGWEISKKPISIKEYFKNMYSMKDEARTCFSIEIDTFKYIAAYFMLREQKKLNKDPGVIYIDFDSLEAIGSSTYKKLREQDTKQQGIGQNITIPHGILAPYSNNDVCAITDPCILKEIFDLYKTDILNKPETLAKLRINGWNLAPNDTFDIAMNTQFGAMEFFIQRGKNKGQHAFFCALERIKNRIEKNMIKKSSVDEEISVGYDVFDFRNNGGEYIGQEKFGEGHLSWLEDHYISEEEKNEQVSEQPDEPSRLIDEIGTKSPSRNACSVQ